MPSARETHPPLRLGGLGVHETQYWVERVYDIVKDSYRTEKLQKPSELLPYLYLGDVGHARNVPMLQALGISMVLNCAPNMVNTSRQTYPGDFMYMAINAEDTLEYKLLPNHLEVSAPYSSMAFPATCTSFNPISPYRS